MFLLTMNIDEIKNRNKEDREVLKQDIRDIDDRMMMMVH
jgi:hypothetical protein